MAEAALCLVKTWSTRFIARLSCVDADHVAPGTDAPGRSASSTIRLLSASLKRWRLPGGVDRIDGRWVAEAGTAPLVI